MEAIFQRSDIKFYDCLLGAILLEVQPGRVGSVASEVEERIRSVGDRRLSDLNIPWMPGLERVEAAIDPSCFKPRVHVVTGTFDVAAVFLTPELEMAPWLQTGALGHTGQDINLGLIPVSPSLEFNDEFTKRLANPPTDSDTFLGLTKVKLNPLTYWPDPKSSPVSECGRLEGTLSEYTKRIKAWREDARGRHPDLPLVGLAIGLGWSEIIVVAYADDPEKLIRLSTSLRQASAEIGPMSILASEDPSRKAHMAATTITAVGYDARIQRRAAEIFENKPHMGAAELMKAVNIYLDERSLRERECSDQVYWQAGFFVYPGHEKTVFNRLSSLCKEMQEGSYRDHPRCFLDVGKIDIWSPELRQGSALPPEGCALLLALLQTWMWSPSAQPSLAFDFYTRITSAQDSTVEEELHDHAKTTGGKELEPPELQEFLDNSLFAELREAMRHLQIPYSLSEQVLNLAGAFSWVRDRAVLWEEALEVMPLILALLEDLKRWPRVLTKRLLGEPMPESDRRERRFMHPALDEEREVSRRLDDLLEREMPEVLRAFRTFFYNRQLSNYLTDELPDLNLRFTGSIHQLLSVGNMILGVFAARLLGRRASLAVIGETVAPEVTSPCGIVVTRLSARVFNLPVLMEALGHEVAETFLRELLSDEIEVDWSVDGKSTLGTGDDLDELKDATKLLVEQVFAGDIHTTPLFREASSDFIEYRLLGYESIGDWIESLFFRAMLVTASTEPHYSTSRMKAVPRPNQVTILSFCHRAVAVGLIEELLLGRIDASQTGLDDFVAEFLESALLGEVRKALYTRALVPTSSDMLRDIADWQGLLLEVIDSQPWLNEPVNIEQSIRFFRALGTYCEKGSSESTSDAYFSVVVDALRELRSSTLPKLRPALHIRHDISLEERKKIRAGEIPEDSEERAWKSSLVPLKSLTEYARTEELPDIKSFIFARGALIARDRGTHRALAEAKSQFFGRLILMVPHWKEHLLRKSVKFMQSL